MAEIGKEQEKTRAEIATYLREFADEFEPGGEMLGSQERGGKVTVIAGNDSATVNPPETLHFGVEVDTDSSLLETGADRRVTFTLRWDADQVEPDEEFDVE